MVYLKQTNKQKAQVELWNWHKIRNGNQMCICELAHALFGRSTELCLEGRCRNESLFVFCQNETKSFQQRQKAKGDTFCCRPVWRQINTAALVFEGFNLNFLGCLLGQWSRGTWYPVGAGYVLDGVGTRRLEIGWVSARLRASSQKTFP